MSEVTVTFIKYCKKCAIDTNHYDSNKKCQICIKKHGKKYRDKVKDIKDKEKAKNKDTVKIILTKYCNVCIKDTIRHANGRCSLCKQIYLKEHRELNKKQQTDIICKYHPHNTYRGSDGANCACCQKEKSMVMNSNNKDVLRGRVKGTMTREYVREQYDKECLFCGTTLIILPEPYNPRSLSMDRINCCKSHDCDPTQTRPVCLQCNLLRGERADAKVFEILDNMAIFVLNGCKFNESISVNLPTDKINGQVFGNWLISSKKAQLKSSKRNINKNLYLDYNFVKYTYEKLQNGQCFACGMFLYKDVSFDQTIPSAGYKPDNITLMHVLCNKGKNIWPLAELHETAIRSMKYRMNNSTHPYPFQIRENVFNPELMNIKFINNDDIDYENNIEMIEDIIIL